MSKRFWQIGIEADTEKEMLAKEKEVRRVLKECGGELISVEQFEEEHRPMRSVKKQTTKKARPPVSQRTRHGMSLMRKATVISRPNEKKSKTV